MVESRQALENQSGNADCTTTGQPYAGSTGTNIDAGGSRTEYVDRKTTSQSYPSSTGTNIGAGVSTSANNSYN